eukprot:CAMPEP_0114452116 /NCGR_PEP_ID=MMETSP0104-20121206/1342_1 /TAXON_ID=37642 ORGANISM="Paraphysomonas imperforata, Strain PA2" /NCGR_SAMPLE_ID=MMETSP0104 /ASSEMBLY_ACC=CAM_ASM_000202 /LENGTH=181 /DNA_ID=CAMNT_0001624343 /DNA_START=134 /DNA_END=680 /DNA_ORIENTATION=+
MPTLVKALYVEPLDNLHWHTKVLELITKPLMKDDIVVDFTVCRDYIFALKQLGSIYINSILPHIAALGLRVPIILVHESDAEPMAEEQAVFIHRLAKPVSSTDICRTFLHILESKSESDVEDITNSVRESNSGVSIKCEIVEMKPEEDSHNLSDVSNQQQEINDKNCDASNNSHLCDGDSQ